MKVLEVGAGTGYNAALMAEIVGDQRLVVTVDVLEDVVDQTRRLLAGAGYPQIQVLLRDGFEGVPEHAPFDRIVATVGCSDLSPHWAGQLAADGAMLVPLEHATGHPLVMISEHDGALCGRMVLRTGFMPVRGPLHIDDLWALGVAVADPAEVVYEPDPGPALYGAATRPADGADRRRDRLPVLPRAAGPPGVLGAAGSCAQRAAWPGPRWLPTGSGGGRMRRWPVSSTGATGTGTRAADRRSRTTGCRSCRSADRATRRPGAGR